MLIATASPSWTDDGGVGAPVDSRMNPVTEGDVVSELVEFSCDRHLASVATGVGKEGKSIVRRYDRIWNHKVVIEEEFQRGDTGARNRAVAGRVSGVSWRTFGKGLR